MVIPDNIIIIFCPDNELFDLILFLLSVIIDDSVVIRWYLIGNFESLIGNKDLKSGPPAFNPVLMNPNPGNRKDFSH